MGLRAKDLVRGGNPAKGWGGITPMLILCVLGGTGENSGCSFREKKQGEEHLLKKTPRRKVERGRPSLLIGVANSS